MNKLLLAAVLAASPMVARAASDADQSARAIKAFQASPAVAGMIARNIMDGYYYAAAAPGAAIIDVFFGDEGFGLTYLVSMPMTKQTSQFNVDDRIVAARVSLGFPEDSVLVLTQAQTDMLRTLR